MPWGAADTPPPNIDRRFVFTRSDGSQVLVVVEGDTNVCSMAERPEPQAVWGPPIEGVER